MAAERNRDLAARGATRPSGPLGVGPFDQDVEALADKTLHVAECKLAFQFEQTSPALGNDRGWYGVFQVRGRCAVAWAIRKDMDLGESDLANHAASGLEIGFGLAGETDDDIRGERRLVKCLADATAALRQGLLRW